MTRKRSHTTLVILTLTFLASITTTMAAPQAFPPTEPGVTEIKTLPAGVLLKSSSDGNYFDRGNTLFRPLFRYISRHNIAMTTPVEAKIEGAAMFFWVAEAEVDKVAGNESGVEVLEVPERLVASFGARGSYSQDNFEKARSALMTWLDSQTKLTATSEPYAVYWHGPFTPWFMKRFEVHVPVRMAKS